MQRRTLINTALASLAAPAACPPSRRTNGPRKPITYIVPFPAGGTTDVLARLIAQKLGPALGTTVIVDNKAGAGGSVGSEIAARAAPDGYTILGGTISSHAINVSLYPKIGYDPVKSFEPITLIGTNPTVLVVNQASPYKTLQDVHRRRQGEARPLTSASAGSGTSQHLSLELLKSQAGHRYHARAVQGQRAGDPGRDRRPGRHDVRHHRRRRPAHRERQAARARRHLGQARCRACRTCRPSPRPACRGFEVVSWQAIFAPAGTPEPIVDRLHTEIRRSWPNPRCRRSSKLRHAAAPT